MIPETCVDLDLRDRLHGAGSRHRVADRDALVGAVSSVIPAPFEGRSSNHPTPTTTTRRSGIRIFFRFIVYICF